ncbi:hypothetical protein RRG08_016527 [Elysia crispata]|uniref:Endonuclease/exonuclease/phosphatase domain-containing protein n=1 Tax=Elysia crispata TaxID=231223 RepID=A0AAE0YYJ8_9GAST|nr:hypothetical protein RRG08_016527 [Elysia crispata]
MTPNPISDASLLKTNSLLTSGSINGFSVFRSDRTPNSEKTRGGGVCAYINSKWCNNDNIHVTDRTCTPCVEVLSLSIRPYYLPREFPIINLNVVNVCIPPQANARQAEDDITSLVHDQLNKYPDSIVVITGDFNHCTLGTSLPTLYQFDKHDFREETRKEVERIMEGSGSHNESVVSENDVSCVFRSVNVRKCGGPDGLKG